jgi:parallel beta-helix repeat protein
MRSSAATTTPPKTLRSLVIVTAFVLLATACHGGASRPIPTVTVPGGSTGGCTVQVASGGDIAGAVASAGTDAVVCLATGTYHLGSVVAPLDGQTIRGTGARAPVVECGAAYCIDGLAGGTGVTVENLVLKDAGNSDLRTNDGWTVVQVEALTAKEKGFNLRGSGVTLRDSYAVADGRFGVVAKNDTSLTIDHVLVLDSPTDASFGIGYSGGVKLNSVSEVSISDTTVSDSQGGAAIWLDNNTRNFELNSNTVVGAAHDGIRVEISCTGTLTGNIVRGAGNAGIDLFNSHDVHVDRSTISGADNWGIRMLGNGRSNGPGGGACREGDTFPATGNEAGENTVTLGNGALVGVEDDGGVVSDLTWTGNHYAVPSCDDKAWQWWTGSNSTRASFAGWQALGLDTSGTCVSTTQS